MNYQKIYNQLIEKAISENRRKGIDVYYERHHIIPKCIGGANDKTNLVLLTAREHFVAHKLLCEIYPDDSNLEHAIWRMAHQQTKLHKRDYIISSYEYERYKILHSKKIKKVGLANKGKRHSNETRKKMSITHTGKVKSIETCKKISKSNKGKQAWNKGLTGFSHSEATKEKMRKPKPGVSEKLKGRKQSDEVIQNRVLKNTGQKRSEETKLKISQATLGKPKKKNK
jgi:hypothetical protein